MVQNILNSAYENSRTLPKREDVFKAFSFFKPEQTKVVILGMDPYTRKEDATGLAFSVPHDNIPGSLKNIFKELCQDIKCDNPLNGDLTPWAKQKVLLLNMILTTEEGKTLAHKHLGWESYTSKVLQNIVNGGQPLVIIAWGRYARNCVHGLNLHSKVLVLEGTHPSPLSANIGFFGGRYFSKCNAFLKKHGLKVIDWKL
jgi:uracil-DNA glycosylase